MTPYKPMYLSLFNAVTDAIVLLERGQSLAALNLLRAAQQASEELYLKRADGEESTIE